MPMGNMFGQYGQFMNDPAAQMAANLSQTALRQGQEYMEQNVCLALVASSVFYCVFYEERSFLFFN